MTAGTYGKDREMRIEIENIEIQNYRLFRRARLSNLPRLAIVVGANGSGKSTLFDVFSFLKDSLTHDVATAVTHRGGFGELVSRGSAGPIGITVQFRESGGHLATYSLEIAVQGGQVVVDREVLRYGRGQHGLPCNLIDFSCGEGYATNPESMYERQRYELNGPAVLAIKGLGQFLRFRLACEFRSLIEGWHISNSRVAGSMPVVETLVLGDNSIPHSLMAVENPEDHLYPDLLPELVEGLRDCARRGSQVFVSTHSPCFLNRAELDEVIWLAKIDGFATVRRASTDDRLRSLVDEGDKLGTLWMQGLFNGAAPR